MAKNTNGAKSAAKPFVVSEEYWVIARTVWANAECTPVSKSKDNCTTSKSLNYSDYTASIIEIVLELYETTFLCAENWFNEVVKE